MTILQLLDEIPHGTGVGDSEWCPELESALAQPNEWLIAISTIDGLSDEQAWNLLSWIEVAASQIVRTRVRATLVTSAFAMSLVLQSKLDRRDCALVASLLRRAAELCGFDYTACVAEGCERAGSVGREALTLLLNASITVPATHLETGQKETFTFERREPEIDVGDLQKWLDGNGR